MAADRTTLSNDLHVIREWLVAAIPRACGAAHNCKTLANYTLALLTSLTGSEEQIHNRCLEELAAFLPQESLQDFVHGLLNHVRTLPSADEILCLSAPQPAESQCCWTAIESTHTEFPSGTETDQGDILKTIYANQRRFEARRRDRLRVDQQRQELVQRENNVNRELQRLKQILARLGVGMAPGRSQQQSGDISNLEPLT